MTKKAEIVVVGGGPAGAAAAFTLGKNGVETILVDKKPKDKIGDKVCGDALSSMYPQKANEMIGLPLPNPETGELKEIINESILQGKSPTSKIILANQSTTVDRLEYGQALIREVEKFPHVEIIADSKLKQVIVEDNFITGVLIHHRDQGEIKIDCKLVIDASGSSGVVRSRLPESMLDKFPKKIPREEMIVAYREIIRTPEPHDYQKGMYLLYEPELKMPGYYWVFSRGKYEANIGLGWMIYDENRGTDIREVNRIIRERRFPNAEVLVSGGDQIPARLPLPSCVHNGFMATGDAAALANPLNGEGHGPALISGIKAAKIATEAVSNGDVSEENLWGYNTWIWENYGVEFSFGIAIVKFINKYGFDTFNWLMEKNIIQEDDIMTIVQDHSPDLNLVRRALRGWYRPNVLWSLRKVMKNISDIQEHARNYPEVDNFQQWFEKLQKLEDQSV